MSLVKGVRQRVYPVGRLDFHSSGLMILTNDGELANFLMARSSAIPRSYQVKLEGRPDPDGIAKLQTGIVSMAAARSLARSVLWGRMKSRG